MFHPGGEGRPEIQINLAETDKAITTAILDTKTMTEKHNAFINELGSPPLPLPEREDRKTF